MFFRIRELLVWLCSSGFASVYSSFSSSHLDPPFFLAVAVTCSFAYSGCFLRLDRKNSFEHCPSPRPAGTTSTQFLQLDGEKSFEHCPSPRPARTTSIQSPQLAYVAATWRSRWEFTLGSDGRGRATQLDTKGLVSIVRSIRLLFAGTRYWVLEYLLADASDFAIASGPW